MDGEEARVTVQEEGQICAVGELFVEHEDDSRNPHAKSVEKQQQLFEELQQNMEATNPEGLQQAEVPDNLKLEALRLSSNNIRTSQMELMQMNLTKEKEIALMELREMLNDKHAQEVAVLQSRYNFELENIKKQNQKEKEEMSLKHQCHMDKKRKEIALEVEEKHACVLENLKREWALESDIRLKHLSEELSVKHLAELNQMKEALRTETEEIKKKLEKLSLEKNETEVEHKNLENKYHLLMKTLQTEHEKELQNIKEQSKKQVGELQQEMEKLKSEEEEEMAQLWSQLDSARTSRQELSNLKVELLAHTSQVEEIEYLKKDFQLKWDKKRIEHENELEQLRLYFEQKLKYVEENYREELIMLHQRLEEVKDYSVVEMAKPQDQPAEFGASVTLLEDMTEKERLDLFEQLTQQLEHHKEELSCLELRLDKKHLHEIELLRSTLTLQYQENLRRMKLELSDRYASEIQQLKRKHSLNLEQLRAKISEEHLKEITKIRLQSAQEAARKVEAEVAEQLSVLENEYKSDCGHLQLEMQSISTQQEEIEKLKTENIELKEISVWQEMHLKEELEQIKCKLIEDHTEELRRTREELQAMEQTHRAKAEEWKDEKELLETEMENQLSLLCKEFQNKAEYEKQNWQRQFDLREAEMISLQNLQAARIVELEKTLKEQQNMIQQLEDSLVNVQKTSGTYQSELSSIKILMAGEVEKAKQVLHEEYKAKYEEAHNRFLEENKKTKAEHEILLQKLREDHLAELELLNKELQQKHKEQILSLTSRQQTEMENFQSTLERKQQTWLETYVADTHRNNQVQIRQLETKHLSDLHSLEATYIFEIQFLQDEHRKTLEDLKIDLKEQLLQKEKENQKFLAEDLNRIKLKHAEELQICEDNLRIELASVHIEKLKIMAAELEEAHKKEVFRIQDLHTVEIKKEKETSQQLQKELEQLQSGKEKLEKEIRSLKEEVEKANSELKNVQQQGRETQEGNTLIALMNSDIENCKNERDKLQESYQQTLKLLLKMVQSAKDMEDLICKKAGLCLDDSLASGDSRENEIMSEKIVLSQTLKNLEEWSIKKNDRLGQGKVLDQTPPEHSFDSLFPDELSEHLCESIFENPDLIIENEERIKKICHCLYSAVEKLLMMLAESTKQLEEMHNMYRHFEEECKRRNWEACHVRNEQHELMDCVNEESKMKNQLMLELHKAKGLIEGYLAERHILEEALKLKEESEQHLVTELESLKMQIHELTQENAKFVVEQKLLISQNRALAANVGEREVELIKELENLTKEKVELQCQAEKYYSTLNTQMKIMEIELEEQLNKNKNLATMASEVIDLKQQIEALERQLKSQRDFMDKQALEREDERDEFQEEIQKLELELKLTTKSQASGESRAYLVESLHSEIKERMDNYNRLFSEKEQLEKDLADRNEEIEKLERQIRELNCLNSEEITHANKLIQELEKMKKREIELQQDKETLQQQQNKNLILISTLQSKLDEARHRVLTDTGVDHMLKEQLQIQEELITKKREVADLLEQLEQFKENLVSKNEEVLQLKSTLDVEKNVNIKKIIQLKEENAHLKENIEKLTIQNQNPGESELVVLRFLKSLLEEKNQETDHLNEQIERLEKKIENSKENEVLEKQMLETEIMKSAIEELRCEKEQLLRNKTEEIEQLHGVIEKLQKESGLCVPAHHEDDSWQDSLNNLSVEEQEEKLKSKLKEESQILLENSKDDNFVLINNSQKEPQRQELSLMGRETLHQLLKEEESKFKMELKILEQNLENVQDSCRQHCSDLTALQLLHKELQEEHKLLKMHVTQKEAEMIGVRSCIQDLEVNLRENETKLLETELQLQIVSEQKRKQAADIHHMKEKMKLETELNVTQTLHNKETTYQKEISELQTVVAELRTEIGKKVEELEALRFEKNLLHSQLKTAMKEDQEPSSSEVKEKREEEGGLSIMLSSSAEFSDTLEEDSMTMQQISGKNVYILNKQPEDLLCIQGEQVDPNKLQQNLEPVSQSTQISQTMSDDFQSKVMNRTLWDSPENMRKQNSLELQASLSLTPFSDADGIHNIGFESLCSENSVIQRDISEFLECPVSYSNSSEETAANFLFRSSAFPGPPSSITKLNVSIKDAEVFPLMLPELQDGLKLTMSRIKTTSTEYDSNTSLDLILQHNDEDPENKTYQDSNVMASVQCFGMFPDVTASAVKEFEMFPQQLKNVLKMVYDESYKILVLSEKALPLDDGDKIQQVPSAEGWQKERLILLDIMQLLKNYLSSSEKENQEQLQKRVVEYLSSSDRNSLLSEIQDLEVQLKHTDFQSQEKYTQLQSQDNLQECQETLTGINKENHGNKQEHQLQKQVELLKYRLQQEQIIVSDLQASLKHEQEKASEMHELLKQEHTAILNLKSDLCESKQTNERLEKSLQEFQNEVIKYRSALENKEKSIKAALEDLKKEHLKKKELQITLDEQQQQLKTREDEKSKAIEELQAALELQCIQNNQLSVALEHEQSANSNLRKELQIEHSRCEALLSKDQNKLLELQNNLESEKKRSIDLVSALNHERVLTEQLTMRLNECGSCKHKDSLEELQGQLYLERSHARELLSIIEKLQQQVFDSRKQTDEMQKYCKESQQEQGCQSSLQVTQPKVQNRKQDIIHILDLQREKEAEMKKGWEQLQSVVKSMRVQDVRTEQGVRKKVQEQQTECPNMRMLQKVEESQHEYTLQHGQNSSRFKELQEMLEDLKEQEKLFKKYDKFPSKNNYANLTFPTDIIRMHVEQQKLENTREQLVLVATYLSEFIYKTIDKTINWSASNEEVIAALLHILELKAELLSFSKHMVIPTSAIHSIQTSVGNSCQEKHGVQNDLKTSESEETKTNFVTENRLTMMPSNLKMQKLYRKYLRAESFRKALVYQKKYLLLLLGGFQECEQATLSLIARMGIYPSPPDLMVSESRSRFFTKFRSAVRVVIAILRLKFLVKKWHKVNKKEMQSEAISPNIGHNSFPKARIEILKQEQFFPDYMTQDDENCNKSNLMRLGHSPPRPPFHLCNRSASYASEASSKDPEHSLTEYIAHLEAIQERLGILMPGQSLQQENS